MTTTLSKRYTSKPDSYYGAAQTKLRRETARKAVLALLDRLDRPRAYGMNTAQIAERAGMAKQSVAQTLASLVREGVVVKAPGHHGEAKPVYFLKPDEATRQPRGDHADTMAAIALYRAEKAKRAERQQSYHNLLAEAKRELERLDQKLDDVAREKRKRGARHAGETTVRKAAARKHVSIAVGWKDAAR